MQCYNTNYWRNLLVAWLLAETCWCCLLKRMYLFSELLLSTDKVCLMYLSLENGFDIVHSSWQRPISLSQLRLFWWWGRFGCGGADFGWWRQWRRRRRDGSNRVVISIILSNATSRVTNEFIMSSSHRLQNFKNKSIYFFGFKRTKHVIVIHNILRLGRNQLEVEKTTIQ